MFVRPFHRYFIFSFKRSILGALTCVRKAHLYTLHSMGKIPEIPTVIELVFAHDTNTSRCSGGPAGEMAFDTFERTTTVSQSHAGAMTKAVNFDIFFLDDGREGIVDLLANVRAPRLQLTAPPHHNDPPV